ncbi:Aspartyl protease [hydrothermal vent metagenome]|uniref:Aspartyl protease n=1 Tax=hydrothermal vent metagenome TaxID=652676 RepID=A0A3B0X4B6_9ZZZZ
MQLPPNSPQQDQKKIGAVMLALMWVGIFIVLGVFFSDILDKQRNPNQSVSTQVLSDKVKELVLKRNRMGHYVANGRINSQPVTFMLDTGATDVSIPEPIARKLQLKPGHQATYQTANGTVQVRMTMLDSISLGDIKLSNVRATINPGYKSHEILLGMSFLKHLEFSQRGNILTLRQYPEGQNP